MFLFFTVLGLTLCLFGLALQAVGARRVRVTSNVYLERKDHPFGYWVVTTFWLFCATACLVGASLLLYQAVLGIGPYKQHAFFSWHQAWPYGLFALFIWWVLVLIAGDWLFLLRARSRE